MANTLYFSANGDATTKIVQFYNPVLQTWVDGTLVDSVTKKYTATMAGIPSGTYNGLKSRLKGSSPEIISIYSEGVIVRDGNTTAPPTGTKATMPTFGTIDDTNNIVGLTSDYAYTEVVWGVEGGTGQQLASNSICSPGNIAGRLFAYVVANVAAGRLQSETRYSTPFTITAANTKPTASISVVGGTATVTPGQSVTLQLGGLDVDAGDNVTKVELLDNGVKIGEIAGASGMLATPALTVGSHSFTARATDSHGATGLSEAVLVSATTGGTGSQTFTFLADATKIRGNVIIGGTYGSEYGKRSPLGAFYIDTDGTAVDITQNCQFPTSNVLPPSTQAIGILTGTTLVLSQSTDTGGNSQVITSTLPGVGGRVLQFIDGPTIATNGDANVMGTFWEQIVIRNATYARVVEKPASDWFNGAFADSIGAGLSPAIPHTQAWEKVLQGLLNEPVYIDAFGGRSWGKHFNTAAKRTIISQRMVAQAQAIGSTKARIWLAVGVNDCLGYGQITASVMRQYLAAFLVQLAYDFAAAGIALTLYVETIKFNTNDTYKANADAFNAAIRGAVSDANVGAKVVDSRVLYGSADASKMPDGIHPDTVLQNQYGQRVFGVMKGTINPEFNAGSPTDAYPPNYSALTFSPTSGTFANAGGEISGTGRALGTSKLSAGADGGFSFLIKPSTISAIFGAGVSRILMDYPDMSVGAYVDIADGTRVLRVIDGGVAMDANVDKTVRNVLHAFFRVGSTWILGYFTGTAFKTAHNYAYKGTGALFAGIKAPDGSFLSNPGGRNLTSLAANAAGNYPVTATPLPVVEYKQTASYTLTEADGVLTGKSDNGSTSLGCEGLTNAVLKRGERVNIKIAATDAANGLLELNLTNGFAPYDKSDVVFWNQLNSDGSFTLLRIVRGAVTQFASSQVGWMLGISRSLTNVGNTEISQDNGETWQPLGNSFPLPDDVYIKVDAAVGLSMYYLAKGPI